MRREGRWILDGIDWTIRAGGRWAIVGPNGSGKTTLLRVASTYLWPSRGREIPAGFDRAMVLTEGTVRASGPIEAVLTDANLTGAYGLPLAVDIRAGRFSARAGTRRG